MSDAVAPAAPDRYSAKRVLIGMRSACVSAASEFSSLQSKPTRNGPNERPRFIAIRRDSDGYGIRFGLTEEEDKLRHGPVFATLPEALAWIASVDGGPIDTAAS
jgi:hypothetical protein